MNETSTDRTEEMVRDVAAAFEYPPTPEIAGSVRTRLFPAKRLHRPLLRWVVAAGMVIVLGVLVATSVPSVRAALLRILQIGAVQIRVAEEPQIEADPLPEPQEISIVDLGEVISMEEAGNYFPLRDPAYPPALGLPDVIYGQNLLYREPVITFLWLAEQDRPQIVLTQIEIPNFGVKWATGDQVQETEVANQRAIWIEGPHRFDLQNAAFDQETRLATNVLIWSSGDLTYRLEGEIALEDALAIAESWQ